MRLAFHYRQPFTRQLALCGAMKAGAKAYGVDVVSVEGFDGVAPGADGLILFGIGGISREIFDAYQNAGRAVVFLDKGYTRRSAMYRIAVNAFQPVRFTQRAEMAPGRWQALGIEPQPYQDRPAGYVIFDGASNKYCLFQKLGDWRQWGQDTLRTLRAHTTREIIYRPRPSHNVQESYPPLMQHMQGASLVVSYGGNIGFDAVVAGVPHFALGDSVARPLSEVDLQRLDILRTPSETERRQWLANIAHCQWSLDEIRAGAHWHHVLEQL